MMEYKLNNRIYPDFNSFDKARKGLEEPENSERKQEADKTKPTKKKVSLFVKSLKYGSVAALCLFFTGFAGLLVLNIFSEERGEQSFNDLRSAKLESAANAQNSNVILPEFEGLYAQNSDFAGWLRIDGTQIDYPVMYKEDDNDFYLTNNFNKEYDPNGTLILDKRCDRNGGGKNVLIHGHNMKSGMMFAALENYENAEFTALHNIIHFDTLFEKRDYEVVAVFKSSVDRTDSEDFQYYEYINIDDEDDFYEYTNGIKEMSMYDSGATIDYDDDLITLSTCEYSKKDGRLVIVGKRVI